MGEASISRAVEEPAVQSSSSDLYSRIGEMSNDFSRFATNRVSSLAHGLISDIAAVPQWASENKGTIASNVAISAAGIAGLYLFRGKLSEFAQAMEQPAWLRSASNLNFARSAPAAEFGSGFRFAWRQKPLLTEDGPWQISTSETAKNSSDFMKTTGLSMIPALKPIDAVGLASKGRLIEKLNTETGDFVRINESSGTTFRLGPLVYEAPGTRSSTTYLLGEAWSAERSGASATVHTYESRAGTQYTSLRIPTDGGFHERRAWSDADGVHTRLDTDLTRNSLTYTLRDETGAVIEQRIMPRNSPLHILYRIDTWMDGANSLEGVKFSQEALNRLLSQHVFADQRLHSLL